MVTNDLKQVLIAYKSLVRRQPWAKNTQDANRFQLLQYREYLAIRPSTVDHPLCHPLARDYTVQDFKRYLQAVQRAKPALVNLTLAAIDHVYQFFGLDRVRVLREDLPKITPRALNPEEQKAFLHAVERSPSLHDQALARLLFYMGMRLSECAFFNANDIIISARKGLVIGRSGEKVSLCHLAIKLLEQFYVLFRFGTFGDDLQTEIMGKNNDDPDYLAAFRVAVHIRNEGAVDFQRIHRNPAQTAEG